MNPLDLRGPEFLVFYIKWAIVVLAVGYVLRWVLARSVFPGPVGGGLILGRYPKEEEAYRIAYLRGGADDVVRTVLARLAAADLVEFGESARRAKVQGEAAKLAPLEARALEAIVGYSDAKDAFAGVRTALASDLAVIEAELKGAGLIRSQAQAIPFAALFGLALATGPGLGVAKFAVALSRGRSNVGFLIVLTALFVMACWALLKPPRRTRAGEQYFDWLRESHRGLKGVVETGRRTSAGEVALCVAVFGLGGLGAYRLLDPLRGFLRPKQASGWFVGSSCGAGCGSGGGCGGGGCGGGGCGGCGG